MTAATETRAESGSSPPDPAGGPSDNPDPADGALARPMGRLRAWLDMIFVDHGFLRLGYRHWKQVAPGVFRSNQPAPFQVRRAARFGIRTIINLRGANDSGHYHLEREACRAAGIELVDFPIKSRRVPPRQMVLDAAALFDRIDYPALLHCKSGIDRSGLMGAIYLLSHGGSHGEGVDPAVALKQFSARYGYLGAGPTGIGKAFIQAYARARSETGVAFLDWVAKGYDPAALEKAFRPRALSTAVANLLLRRE